MEVWVKFQQADFESEVIQTIVAAGMCKLHIRKTCYITGAVIICSIINESLYLIFKKNYLPFSIINVFLLIGNSKGKASSQQMCDRHFATAHFANANLIVYFGVRLQGSWGLSVNVWAFVVRFVLDLSEVLAKCGSQNVQN